MPQVSCESTSLNFTKQMGETTFQQWDMAERLFEACTHRLLAGSSVRIFFLSIDFQGVFPAEQVF